MFYLDFQNANCKNCYKCLRSCPVKAIDARDSQAKIIESRCILCGHCVDVCPQNAKSVHNDAAAVEQLLGKSKPVIASVAPSFVSSFDVQSFEAFREKLVALGFADAFETAEGAAAVTAEYKKLLESGKFENLITSACPAVNRAIRLYHKDVLKYLAPVDSPMVAHAKILRERYKNAEIVFIGPCIAKKREAKESGIIAGALTFEELAALLKKRKLEFAPVAQSAAPEQKRTQKAEAAAAADGDKSVTRAKFYPISRGVIKSFGSFPSGYEYIAVDGVDGLTAALDSVKNLNGLFLEVNACEGACVNGPCAIKRKGGAVEANMIVRNYTNRSVPAGLDAYPSLACEHKPLAAGDRVPTEDEIRSVLSSTGKTLPSHELNCGACGYSTCREKAWAVVNGYAEVEMCVPYMREKAESMGNVIIENSPNGIIVCNGELKITEINRKAEQLIGIASPEYIFDCFDPTAVFKALESGRGMTALKQKLEKTGKYADVNIVPLKNEKSLLIVLTDVTDKVNYDAELDKVKADTLNVTTTVIDKQMRVAQEIASLLGETTAETKIALLKLKDAMIKDKHD